MNIEIFDGDVTTLDVDAIQNAANGRLMHGAGVAGAIRRAGDPWVQRESDALVERCGEVPVGQAAVTTSGGMPARYVIHAVTMAGPGSRCSAQVVKDATRATLAQAENLGAKSVALVALGTGVGRLDPEVCASCMMREVYRHEATASEPMERIVFAVPGLGDVFEKEVARWS